MILSDTDIRRAIDLGHIGIDPFDSSRLNPASYTLGLGDRLLVLRPGSIIDADAPQQTYDEVIIGEDGYVVYPGDLVLGSVAESLTIASSLAARLDARTSLARIGLNVLQGSTHIEPGQRNSHETLEISNIGPNPVRLRAGMKIVKVVFERLETPAAKGYNGSYVGQVDGRVRGSVGSR